MPKSEKIPPPVPSADRFNVLVAQPKKWIEDTLNITLPKPTADLTKLGAEMAKTKKPAEFYITLDGEKFSLEIRAGTFKQIVAQVNLAAQKDNDKEFEILRGLVSSTKIFTQAELDAWNNKHLTSAQASFYHAMVVEYEGKVDNLKKVTKALASPAFETLDPSVSKDFREWAQAHSTLHYLTFIDDIDSKADPKAIFDKYVKKDATFPVNLGDPLTKEIEKAITANQAPDFTAVRAKTLKAINTVILPKFKKEKLPGYQKELTHDSDYLEKVRKHLKDAGES